MRDGTRSNKREVQQLMADSAALEDWMNTLHGSGEKDGTARLLSLDIDTHWSLTAKQSLAAHVKRSGTILRRG